MRLTRRTKSSCSSYRMSPILSLLIPCLLVNSVLTASSSSSASSKILPASSSSSSSSSHPTSNVGRSPSQSYSSTPLGSSRSSLDRILSPRQIKTKYGFLRGLLISPSSSPSQVAGSSSTSSIVDSLTPVEAFLGVPYAAPPVGSLRFLPPVTPSPWKGVKVTNHSRNPCPQKLPKMTSFSKGREEQMRRMRGSLDEDSEDCLYLNVYAPYVKESSSMNERFQVMFFVTGDSYDWGSGSSLDGTILSSLGRVIVVTLNYRLGLFGFLPTTIEGSKRGNYALMDIIASLHWIHDNIYEMGGDPSNITLVGYDRGAAISNLLMISPMARGLFSRVILMSGSALSPVSISSEADFFSQSLAKSVNCDASTTADSSSHLLDCLRTKSVDELNKVNFGNEDSFRTSFGPIVDGLLIPTDPSILMESTNSSNHHLSYLHPMGLRQMMPGSTRPVHSLMFGVSSNESPCIFTENEEVAGIDILHRDRVLYSFVKNTFDYYQEVISLLLLNEYTDWTSSSSQSDSVKRLESLQEILSDGLVVSALVKAGSLHQKHQMRRMQESKVSKSTSDSSSDSKSFFYVFNLQKEKKVKPGGSRLRCLHGQELSYLFGSPIASLVTSSTASSSSSNVINYTEGEIFLSKTVINYFSNFAKFGNPNGIPSKGYSMSSTSSPFWPEFDEVSKKYLNLDVNSSLGSHYRSHQLSIWANLIPKLQELGRVESETFKRHLQDQQRGKGQPQNNPEVAYFERISLKFLDNLKPAPNPTGVSDTSSSTASPSSKSSPDVSHAPPGAHSVGSPSSKKTTIILHPETEYSAALSLTIGVGLTLLILNILVFTGVYYKIHAGKNRNEGRPGSTPTNSSHHHSSRVNGHSSRKGSRKGNGSTPNYVTDTNSLSRQRVNSRKNSFSTSATNSPSHLHHLSTNQQQQTYQTLNYPPGHHLPHSHHHHHSTVDESTAELDYHQFEQQQQQQQLQQQIHHHHHPTVTFNDYISHHPLHLHHPHHLHHGVHGSVSNSSNNSSPVVSGVGQANQAICVKYSPSPNSVDLIPDDCYHDMYGQGLPIPGQAATRTSSLTISSSINPTTSTNSTSANDQADGPDGGTSLTVIQEMDEHL